jgi:hypothetical protein
VTALAGGVIAVALVLAADGVSRGRARWRTWAACGAQIAGIGALAAGSVLVARLLG